MELQVHSACSKIDAHQEQADKSPSFYSAQERHEERAGLLDDSDGAKDVGTSSSDINYAEVLQVTPTPYSALSGIDI